MSKELDQFYESARLNLLPKMKESALCLSIMGEPDPKLCMEIGAAILFDKPIIAVVPKGVTLPLSLRTIAHKVIELDDPNSPADRQKLAVAIKDVMAAWEFRKGPRES